MSDKSGLVHTVVIKGSGIILGALPTIILFSLMLFTATKLCKKWEAHKQKKKATIEETPIEMETTTEAETPAEVETATEAETFCETMQNNIAKEVPVKKVNSSVKKKILRIVLIIVIICAVCAGGVLACFVYEEYQRKMDSYDFTTDCLLGSFNFREGGYCMTWTSASNKTFSDLFYFEDNYYVNVFMNESNAEVYESGIYEIDGDTLMTKSEDGEIKRYIIGGNYFKYIIGENSFFYGEAPKKDTFDATFRLNYSDNIFSQIAFKNDGTYLFNVGTDVYNGKYKRNGFIIKGTADDVMGSYNWLVYDGKITWNFYTNDIEKHIEDRLKYEFYKYVQEKSDSFDVSAFLYIREYEEEHPITIGK